MTMLADKKRKRMQDLFHLWGFVARASRNPAHADRLRAIQEDVIITSPKIYESGIITNLNLRLVDLYGDDAIARDDLIRAPAAHELAC